MRHFKHLSFCDRLKLETMTKDGKSPREIAGVLHVHTSTVYRELKRGRYMHMKTDLTMDERYSPDIAHGRYRENLAAKGAPLKIGTDHDLARYIEDRIVCDHYSPAAVLGEIREQGIYFQTTICTSTLYSYIEKGVFLTLTNKELPYKGRKKRAYKKVRHAARPPAGESIERRPAEINARGTFGHWEMDCVVGKKRSKKVWLVLTERKTRNEIIEPMKDQTAASVVAALDRIERRFGKLFQKVFSSITVDNGSEFADCEGMERSVKGNGKRTKVYYCHPYSSWERGSNENQNRMIRRQHPKGTDFRKVSAARAKQTEEWMNRYPRAIFGYRSSKKLFDEHIKSIR